MWSRCASERKWIWTIPVCGVPLLSIDFVEITFYFKTYLLKMSSDLEKKKALQEDKEHVNNADDWTAHR